MSYENIAYEGKPRIKSYLVIVSNRTVHFHNDFELIYVLSGSLEMECGGVREKLRANDIVVLEPNRIHAFTQSSERNMLLVIQFSAKNMRLISEPLSNMRLEKNVLHTQDIGYSRLRNAFAEYMELCGGGDDGELPLRRLSYIFDLCTAILEEMDCRYLSQEAMKRENEAMVCLNKVMDCIDENLALDLTVNELAQMSGIGEKKISRLFHDYFGMTVNSYINAVRVQLAAKLILSDQDAALTDICSRCGFPDLRAFNRVFSGYHGCRPSVYRSAFFRREIDFDRDFRKGPQYESSEQWVERTAEYLCTGDEGILNEMFDELSGR